MTNLKPMLLAGATILGLSTPVWAFTSAGPVVETGNSELSTTWQPMVAERGDSIWDACVGFTWKPCLKEFVQGANSDIFPETITSEAQFGLRLGSTYMVPVLAAGTTAAPIVAPTESYLETFQAEIQEEQERLAKELSTVRAELSSLDVSDISGLNGQLTAIAALIPDNSGLEALIARLQAELTALQSSGLTEKQNQEIVERIGFLTAGFQSELVALAEADGLQVAQLSGLQTELTKVSDELATVAASVLSQAALDLGQDDAIAANQNSIQAVADSVGEVRKESQVAVAELRQELKSDIAGLQTDVATLGLPIGHAFVQSIFGETAATQYVEYKNVLTVLVSSVALLLMILIGLATAGLVQKKTKGRVTDLETVVGDEETGLASTRTIAVVAGQLVGNVRDDLVEVKEDVATVVKIAVADIDWSASNASLEDLAVVQYGLAVTWHFAHNGTSYVVLLGRNEDSPAGTVHTNILRSVDSGQCADPIALKRLKLRITEALAAGRIQATPLAAVAAG